MKFLVAFGLFYMVVLTLLSLLVAFLFLAICFISWNIPEVANLLPTALAILRVLMVVSFLVTSTWIFTEGRSEWNHG